MAALAEYSVQVVRNGVPGQIVVWASSPQEAQARAGDTVGVVPQGLNPSPGAVSTDLAQSAVKVVANPMQKVPQ